MRENFRQLQWTAFKSEMRPHVPSIKFLLWQAMWVAGASMVSYFALGWEFVAGELKSYFFPVSGFLVALALWMAWKWVVAGWKVMDHELEKLQTFHDKLQSFQDELQAFHNKADLKNKELVKLASDAEELHHRIRGEIDDFRLDKELALTEARRMTTDLDAEARKHSRRMDEAIYNAENRVNDLDAFIAKTKKQIKA